MTYKPLCEFEVKISERLYACKSKDKCGYQKHYPRYEVTFCHKRKTIVEQLGGGC